MTDDKRLDLSALDPMREPGHWADVVDATLARVDAVLRERAGAQDPLVMISEWVRPLLVAAAITVAVLIPIEAALESDRAEQIQRLVTLSTDWAHGGEVPSGSDLLRALGEGRVR